MVARSRRPPGPRRRVPRRAAPARDSSDGCSAPDERRRAAGEVLDLSGVARDHAIDVLARGAGAAGRDRAAPHLVRGRRPVARRNAPAVRSSRRADARARGGRRPPAPSRSSCSRRRRASARPHELSAGRGDVRGHAGEAARRRSSPPALRDVLEQFAGRFAGLYVIRPEHNPVGPFDFAGVYDERSDRRYTRRRARRPRLRRRLPPVHRPDRRRERRADAVGRPAQTHWQSPLTAISKPRQSLMIRVVHRMPKLAESRYSRYRPCGAIASHPKLPTRLVQRSHSLSPTSSR